MKMYRLVVVILGLLCILQAALIIYLNLEASGKNLTEERDDLKRTVKDYVSEQNSLTEERDNLKRINLDMVATNKNLAKERDDLGRTLRAGGWKYFSGSLYTISSINKNWQASRDDCLQKGADLVIVNSQEEQKYITSFGERVWIGLTDRATEGRWKWVDGTPLTTSYWYRGEPNGNSKLDEDCAQIFPANVGEGWLDYHCSYTTNRWICEKRLP
ncbi:CD209 antigen-like protein C [Trematomus bernacchii]|uniref:CD209 antigen-like protein C n=1 Tax=Trematomus bernacchii TaxID=40690 RepID=UPI00146B63B4|nr:CD209 antigen-like protein C [Trematomus bernacchii]